MVANALWGWLDQWRKAKWQPRGKAIWAAEIWQDIAAWVEKLTVKVHSVNVCVLKSQANEVTTSWWIELPRLKYLRWRY